MLSGSLADRSAFWLTATDGAPEPAGLSAQRVRTAGTQCQRRHRRSSHQQLRSCLHIFTSSPFEPRGEAIRGLLTPIQTLRCVPAPSEEAQRTSQRGDHGRDDVSSVVSGGGGGHAALGHQPALAGPMGQDRHPDCDGSEDCLQHAWAEERDLHEQFQRQGRAGQQHDRRRVRGASPGQNGGAGRRQRPPSRTTTAPAAPNSKDRSARAPTPAG